jgi:hypothetical protein
MILVYTLILKNYGIGRMPTGWRFKRALADEYRDHGIARRAMYLGWDSKIYNTHFNLHRMDQLPPYL